MKIPSFLIVLCLLPTLAYGQAVDAPEIGAQTDMGDFEIWLEGVRMEARQRGISEGTLQTALGGIKPIPRIIELDRNQAEFTLTLAQYLDRVIPPSRVKKAREKLAENRALLAEIEAKYGVQARFIVAFWGIESDFGRLTGGFPVIAALATLAHDGRRSAFFRKELLHALTIVDQGHITAAEMTGSWAGAMGQTQFMPSTFISHATDYDGDKRIDIWNNRADALASGANYLRKAGWNPDLTWGREVRLPAGFDTALAGRDKPRLIEKWQALGVRRGDGSDLPKRRLQGSIILPEGNDGGAYLVYANFDVILDWNRSNFFAIAVGRLADQLNGL